MPENNNANSNKTLILQYKTKRGDDYKTFEIVSSSDSKNYGYDKNFNLDAENFLQDKEFQELKETIVGSLFQFTFDGELVKQEESGAFLGVEEGKSYKWKKLTSSVPTQSGNAELETKRELLWGRVKSAKILEHLIKGDPNLSHEKISAKIRKLNPDALPEGTEWKERIEPTDLFITDISQLLEYVRLCAEAIMSLKEEIDDEERFDLEKRIKGRSLDLLEVLKTSLHLEDGKINEKLDSFFPITGIIGEGESWQTKLAPDNDFLTGLEQINGYILSVHKVIVVLTVERVNNDWKVLETERDNWKERVRMAKEVWKNIRAELKTHQEKENDNLKAAKKYVLSELEELKYFLCDDETLNKEANKIKEDIVPQDGDWKIKLDPNDKTLTIPEQLVEYFAIISKAIRNIRNDVNLSKVSGTVELLLLNMLNSSNADDEMLEAEISRLSPDALTDNASWGSKFRSENEINNVYELFDYSLLVKEAIESLAKKLAINDLKRLKDYKGCLKDDELNKAVNEVKPDAILEGENWETLIENNFNMRGVNYYARLVRNVIITLKLNALKTERNDWKARAKEVTQDAKEQLQDVRDQLKIHQDALVGAQAEALQVLRTQQGDLDDADINDQIQADDTKNGTTYWDEQNNWDDKLRSDASHFATAHALNTYVLAVSVAIEKVRKQKLDQTKKDILAGLENNFLQDATIKDADINQEINKLMGAGFITGTDNWKKLFEKEDNRIDGYENFTWTATMVIHAINQAKINQDLQAAKKKALDDLKELKGEITDKKITKKVNETYPHTITGTDWTVHLATEDDKITKTWQLAEYVGKIAKVIKTKIVSKEQKSTRTAKRELTERENKINDLLGSPHATPLPNDWENCLVKKSIIVGDLGLTDYAELAIKLDGANLGTQTDANLNGIPDGKTLKQLIDDYNSSQTRITAYEKIIKDDLGFDPASPDLNTQIKKQLGGIELAEISIDLKRLVDRYNISNDLQGKLSQVEKEALAAQKELEKYQDFVRRLAKNIIGVVDNHSEKNDLSVLEKDISDWLKDYKEKIENELLTEINTLGLGLNDITKEKVLKVIKELINKPNPDTEIVEKLRDKIHDQGLIITDYQSGDKYMSKEMISNKMQETLKILKIPTSQYYQVASAQSLPEMEASFEKLLREEVNQKEKARNKLIKINVILAVLTIGSLLTLVWALIMIKQKNDLPKIEKTKKKGSSRNRLKRFRERGR